MDGANTQMPYAGIICPAHGKVDINRQEYTKQMDDPDALWVCPRCGEPADFDDDRYEELQGIE